MNLGASRATNAVLSDMNCDLFSKKKKNVFIYLFSLLRSVLSSGTTDHMRFQVTVHIT